MRGPATKQKSILSLDVSTSAIGWAIVSSDPSSKNPVLDCGFIVPKKIPNHVELLISIRGEFSKFLEEKSRKYIIEKVVIEECIMHMQHSSSAKTITKLYLFNRFISLLVHDELKIMPSHLSVNTVRAFLRKLFSLQKIDKTEVPALLCKKYKIPALSKLLSPGKDGRIKKTSKATDVADAIALGLCSANRDVPQEKKKTTKKKALTKKISKNIIST